MTAASYARALYALVTAQPRKGSTYLKNLRAALERRGHEKLLPRIAYEYEKLVLKEGRAAMHARATPEGERTRALTELYRRLISTP